MQAGVVGEAEKGFWVGVDEVEVEVGEENG